jgi:hypothetical protein
MQVVTNGDNMWNAEDDYTYVYQNVADTNKKVVITATVDSLSAIEGSTDAATGIMIRDKDEAGAYNVDLRVLPDGKIRMTYRNADKPTSWYFAGQDVKFPAQLKLERDGDVFRGYILKNDLWAFVAEINVSMGTDVLAGVASIANKKGKFIEAQLSQIKIEK